MTMRGRNRGERRLVVGNGGGRRDCEGEYQRRERGDNGDDQI